MFAGREGGQIWGNWDLWMKTNDNEDGSWERCGFRSKCVDLQSERVPLQERRCAAILGKRCVQRTQWCLPPQVVLRFPQPKAWRSRKTSLVVDSPSFWMPSILSHHQPPTNCKQQPFFTPQTLYKLVPTASLIICCMNSFPWVMKAKWYDSLQADHPPLIARSFQRSATLLRTTWWYYHS